MKQLSFIEVWAPPPVLDLTSYDIILLNTSAGKDSQAMLSSVHANAIAAGVADRLIAVHCDLGRMEWPGTKELAQLQSGIAGNSVCRRSPQRRRSARLRRTPRQVAIQCSQVLHIRLQTWTCPRAHDQASESSLGQRTAASPHPQLHGTPSRRVSGPRQA